MGKKRKEKTDLAPERPKTGEPVWEFWAQLSGEDPAAVMQQGLTYPEAWIARLAYADLHLPLWSGIRVSQMRQKGA